MRRGVGRNGLMCSGLQFEGGGWLTLYYDVRVRDAAGCGGEDGGNGNLTTLKT